MPASHKPSAFLPLSEAAFEILLALCDEPRHGYGIMTEVAERTAGGVRLGPGTVYGAIKRLREQGLVDPIEACEPGTDERRRLYCITPLGREVAVREAHRIERLVQSARLKLLLPQATGA